MIHAQGIAHEEAHLAGTHNQDSHLAAQFTD
jgi:hypothetical protein